jgi:hypothetical protein
MPTTPSVPPPPRPSENVTVRSPFAGVDPVPPACSSGEDEPVPLAEAEAGRRNITVTATRRRPPVNGLLLWGLVLPVLLVIAGIVTLRRRKGRR